MNDLEMMINEQRLLVFLENDEQNGFNQVLLDSRQFKKVSDAIFRESHKDPSLKEGFEIGTITLSEEEYPAEPFDGLNSIDL